MLWGASSNFLHRGTPQVWNSTWFTWFILDYYWVYHILDHRKSETNSENDWFLGNNRSNGQHFATNNIWQIYICICLSPLISSYLPRFSLAELATITIQAAESVSPVVPAAGNGPLTAIPPPCHPGHGAKSPRSVALSAAPNAGRWTHGHAHWKPGEAGFAWQQFFRVCFSLDGLTKYNQSWLGILGIVIFNVIDVIVFS